MLRKTSNHLDHREELMLANHFFVNHQYQYGFITEVPSPWENDLLEIRQELCIKIRTDKSLGPCHVLLHHDKMNQFWRKFADSLQGCRFEGMQHFEGSKIQLPKSVLDMLMTVLGTKNISISHITQSRVGVSWVLSAFHVLEGS